MRNARLLWLISGCTLATLITYAQCPALRSDWDRLQKNTTLEASQLAGQALALQKRWSACHESVDTSFVRLLLFTGTQFRQQGKYAEAIGYYQQGVKLATTRPENRALAAQAHYLAGSSYLYDNRAEQATASLLQALRWAKGRDADLKWAASSLLNLAYISASGGEYQQALTYAESGSRQAVGLNKPRIVAQLLREKANALYWLGRYDEAIVTIEEACRLSIAAAVTDVLPQLYLLLGDIESNRNKDVSAMKAYQKVVQLADQANDTALKGVVLNNLGYLYFKQKNYPRAVQTFQEALQVETNPMNRVRLLDNIASALRRQGQYTKALSVYQQSLAAVPNIRFAASDITKNPAAESIRSVLQREYLLTTVQDKADAWLDYARATGNNKQRLYHALHTYQVADQMIDFMRWEHTEQQSKLFWRNKTRTLYERAIETCWRLGDAEQAFRFIEKSRAVMLADKLNELGARRQLTAEQNAEEKRLQATLSEQQTALANAPAGRAYDSLRVALLDGQVKLDRFRRGLEASNPAYYRYKYDTTTTHLADLKAYLTERKASYVSYFIGDSSLYVLGVAGGRTTLVRQPLSNYSQTVHSFMNLLANPDAMNQRANVRQFMGLGHSLYQQLLAPVGLPEGRVIVSPDGAFVPFEALSRSASTADYLVQTNAFSYAYSARLLLKNETRASATANLWTTDFLGVAPVTFAAGLGQVSLPGSDAALQPIADRFKSSVLLVHAQARRRTFLDEAARARVVHLFTHAIADDSTGQEPQLYFADSTLQLSDLSNNDLFNTQLVVLAACKTGIGANQRGEGVFSLARGFAALGVPSVLTTLWSVENKATYDITNLFYRYLAEGMPKDVALQRAQRDWLARAEGENQLPNYWAGLIVVGDAAPLDQPLAWPWMAGSALLLLSLGLVWAWWRRRRRVAQPSPQYNLS